MKRTRLIRFSVRSFGFVLLMAVSSLSAVGQDLDDVTFSGRVADIQNAIVQGASVTAIHSATGIERTVLTDKDGNYRIIELRPGLYTIRVSFEGFATEERTEISTVAGQNVRLDFALRPADVAAEEVIVSDTEAPLVDTTRTIVGGTIETEDLESLPNPTREPLDLIFTLGGVTEEALSTRDLAEDRDSTGSQTPEEAGTFSLSGGPAYSNNITIDGLDNNDDRAARERFQPSIESIAEVQVIRNQFSAEYGRASGGRLNLRTRSGATRYRGRLFYFFRDEALNANTFRNNMLGLSRLPLQQHTTGFTYSGPLVIPKKYFGPVGYDGKRRTFFFVSYEYDTFLDTALIDTLVPVVAGPFPLPAPTHPQANRLEDVSAPALAAEIAPFINTVSTPNLKHIFTARVDHKYSDRHNATFSHQLGRAINKRGFGGGNRLAEALVGRLRNSDAISYSDNFVLSSTAVNQFRIQFSRLTPGVKTDDSRSPVILISINDSLVAGDPERRSGTLIAGSSTTGASDREEQRIQVQDSFSYLTGSHSLKFGIDAQRIRSTFIDLGDATGTFNFASAGDFLAGIPSRYRHNFQTESTQQNTYFGIYFQDEWRFRPNFVFSYGLRYERETILKDTNNFGPRLAIAYDPFKTGKTVIRAGAGIFYNRVLLRTVDDFTLGSQQLFFDTNVLPTAERAGFIAMNISFPQVLTVDSPVVQQLAVTETGFFRQLEQNIRIPESYQVNVGFERQLGRVFVFEANYTWNRGIHLWREFNVNAPVLPAGFSSFTEYLLSRDFSNFRQGPGGSRPIFNAATAGELVRFTTTSLDPANPNAIVRVLEFGVPVSVFNINSTFGSNTATIRTVALSALRDLRPDPNREQVEQLASIGNSFYHGMVLNVRSRFRRLGYGFRGSFRAAYTFSFLTDDGIVNTSSALRVGDFRGERSRSLLDRRHRFVFSGTFDTPGFLGKLRFSPVLRLATGSPFNISMGGVDRNLDDVNNDRPSFAGDFSTLRWRRPGEPINPAVVDQFFLPPIGSSGNLPRNAGIGPGQFFFDISVHREFRFKDGRRLRPVIEINNVFNKTVFSFGAEFINFTALGETATPAQRQAFLDSFFVTTRTLRPRQIRVGLRFDF